MLISLAYAQEAASAVTQTTEAGTMQAFILPIILLAVFWLLLWRPQMKRNKEHAALVSGLQVGDEVVTHAGFTGKIVKMGESNYLTLEISSNKHESVQILIQKMAIASVLPKGTIDAL